MHIFGFKAYLSVKLLDDHFANDQTQAYPLSIEPTF